MRKLYQKYICYWNYSNLRAHEINISIECIIPNTGSFLAARLSGGERYAVPYFQFKSRESKRYFRGK